MQLLLGPIYPVPQVLASAFTSHWILAPGLRLHGQAVYPTVVRKLGEDLPELLTFFQFPRQLSRKLRTTNVIERRFVEVRRRTRPMFCFVNAARVDRIILSIFNRFNEQWRNRTLRLFTQTA